MFGFIVVIVSNRRTILILFFFKKWKKWGKHNRASPESKANLLLLSSICIFSAVHELLHVAGFNHEHNRKIRDKYIWINKRKLRQKHNYDKIKHNYDIAYDAFECPEKWSVCQYDMCSIMHYPKMDGVNQGDYDGRGQWSCKCNYVDFSKWALPPCWRLAQAVLG